jgi:hypothetical protein
VAADAFIAAAYFAISVTLAYLLYKARRDIPFHGMFLAFGLFIIACGGTHFMEVVTIWIPILGVRGFQNPACAGLWRWQLVRVRCWGIGSSS